MGYRRFLFYFVNILYTPSLSLSFACFCLFYILLLFGTTLIRDYNINQQISILLNNVCVCVCYFFYKYFHGHMPPIPTKRRKNQSEQRNFIAISLNLFLFIFCFVCVFLRSVIIDHNEFIYFK